MTVGSGRGAGHAGARRLALSAARGARGFQWTIVEGGGVTGERRRCALPPAVTTVDDGSECNGSPARRRRACGWNSGHMRPPACGRPRRSERGRQPPGKGSMLSPGRYAAAWRRNDTALPIGWGRAVFGPWYHPCLPRRSRAAASAARRQQLPSMVYPCRRRRAMHRPANGSRLTRIRVTRRRLLSSHRECGGPAFGAQLEGLLRWRFPLPLRSNRGSLSRSRQVLVLVVAVTSSL